MQSTFDEILVKTIRVAQNLQKFNYEPGNVVGVIANNNPDLAPILFASFCLGYPVSPIDASFGKTELKTILKITKPLIYFCELSAYDLLDSCLRELGLDGEIFTFKGQRRRSTAVETLFAETGIESDFL